MSGPPVTLRCTGLAGGGWGVAHTEGATWMVLGALPGETVRALELFRRGGVVHGKVQAVLEGHHAARVHAPCPHAPRCGGCDWPHVDPAAGALLKAQVAAGAGRGDPELRTLLAGAPVIPSPPAYRLRARLHWDPAGTALGFYAPHSWEVEAVETCTVLSGTLLELLPALAQALNGRTTVPVDLEWLEDLEGERAVIGLRPARNGPGRIDPAMLPPEGSLPPVVTGAWILRRSGAAVEGWGHRSVVMNLPAPLSVPVGAFFQGNRHLVPWLFQRIGELAGQGAGAILDLHAGVGFLAAAAARTNPSALLTLVEPFRPAARAAAANLPGAQVMAGSTAEVHLHRTRDLPAHALVIADPPRAGLSKRLRRLLISWAPRRIMMLSCDPGTWTRDARALLDAGYELRHLELVDLFPSTHHVETLSVLEKP